MSELNRTQLTAENNASFPNNNTGFITPTLLREFNQDVVDSMAFQSQVDAIQTDLNSLVLSGSGVVVQEDGVNLGPVTDLNFSGSAVEVTVSGSVALINISPDFVLNDYATTASLNAFTASQDAFNVAATASIVALQNFSSSLDATFATDAELNASSSTLTANLNASSSALTANLNASSSVLQGNIDLKTNTTTFNSFTQSQATINQNLQTAITIRLLTSSFNAYTQSNDTAISVLQSEVDSLQVVTGSYATTGSNTFNGNQLFNGSLNVTGDITASKLLVQIETASVIYSSGSNQFGDAADDVQTLYGSVRVVNQLTASGLNYPAADGLVDQFLTTNGAGNLSFSNLDTILEDVYTGEAITKGDPLYISGSQGAKPIVYRADAAVSAKMPVTFVAYETIGAGEDSRGIVLGLIEGMNLTGYNAGQEVYVAEGGGWSTSRPTGSNSITQLLGIVTKGGNGGKGLVLNPGPATLPNLQEGYAWVGNGTNQPVAVATSSFGSPIDTSAFATTGSNTFTGNQTIASGSKLLADTIEAANPYGLTIQGQGAGINLGGPSYGDPVSIFSSTASIDTNGNKLSVTGSIEVTGDIFALNGLVQAQSLEGDGAGVTNVDAFKLDGNMATTFAKTGSNEFVGNQTISGSILVTDKIESTGSLILKPDVSDPRYLNVYNTSAQDTHITASGGYLFLGDDETYVFVNNFGSDRNIGIKADNGIAISGSTQITGSVDITGDYKVNGVPISTSTIDTGSFATTGSNTFNGDQTITTGSFLKTNLITKTFGDGPITIDGVEQGIIIKGGAGNSIENVTTFEDGIKVNQITAQDAGVDGGDITINPYIGGDVIISTDIQVSGDAIVTGSILTNTINAQSNPLVIDAVAGISLAMSGDKLGVSGSIAANGVISSVSGFSGDGSSLTNVNATSLGGLAAARYATTGSNTFTGAQTISSASFSTAISSIAINQTDASGGAGQSKLLGFAANPTNIGGPYASWSPQPTLYGIGSAGPYQIAVFQSQGNFTDGRVSLQRPLVVTGSLTASLQQGYAWVGGAGGVSTAVPTSSFTGSGGGISAISIGDEGTTQGTATYLNFTGEGVTATVSSNTASINIAVSASGAFPYTGSAEILGSLGVTGSITARVAGVQDGVRLSGRAGGTDSFFVNITPLTLTANRTLQLANGNTTLVNGTMVETGRTITINGTTNQIVSSAGAQDLSANRTWTLSLPQDIAATSKPTFAGINLSAASAVTGSFTARPAAEQDGITLVGRAGGTNNFSASIFTGTLTANRSLTLSGDGNTTLVAGTMVPTSRTLTINGTAFDLSADRSWTVTASAFPFTGSAQITGSVEITGSVSSQPVTITVASNTASIDMSRGDFFLVNLGASANTFFNVSNFRPGETSNILVTTNTASTASFSSNIRQVSGSSYVPTTTSGSKDILTLISFTTTEAYLASVKNLV